MTFAASRSARWRWGWRSARCSCRGRAVGPGRGASAEALASLVALGVVCTALAFVLYFTLIAEVGPRRAAAGLLLILAGSWLSTGGRPPDAFALRTGRAPRSA